jgi:hypothetical protein
MAFRWGLFRQPDGREHRQIEVSDEPDWSGFERVALLQHTVYPAAGADADAESFAALEKAYALLSSAFDRAG